MALTSIRLYNLRKHVRARTSQRDPLHCRVLCPYSNAVHEGAILDVSEGGAGIVAVEGAFEELVNGQRVTLRFTLPDANRVFRVESAVRHVRTEDGRVIFGVEFGHGDSLGFFALQLARLRAFIHLLFRSRNEAPFGSGANKGQVPEDPS